MTLPSSFQVGDQVSLSYGYNNQLNDCEVAAVRFTNYGKVLYDIYVKVDEGVEPDDVSEIVAVDSCFVKPHYNPALGNDAAYKMQASIVTVKGND